MSRQCGPVMGAPINYPGEDKCVDESIDIQGDTYKGTYCYCSTELCNAAGHVKVTFGIVASALLAYFML